MRLVGVDGRSGSGKSTLAATLVRGIGGQLVRVEDFYPGWEGLDAGASYVVTDVLIPLRAGEAAPTRRWDWHDHRFVDGSVVEPIGLIVVEGCGAISRASRPLLDVAVWLEADERIRYTRATTRDGDESWWPGWRAQEDAFYQREQSSTLADRILSADAGVEELLALLND